MPLCEAEPFVFVIGLNEVSSCLQIICLSLLSCKRNLECAIEASKAVVLRPSQNGRSIPHSRILYDAFLRVGVDSGDRINGIMA